MCKASLFEEKVMTLVMGKTKNVFAISNDESIGGTAIFGDASIGDKAKPTDLSNYVYAKQSANTLFHFMEELKFLVELIKCKKIYPRYSAENYSFLPKNFPVVVFPMKCFCDIYIEKLYSHISKYGKYGIGFDKKWMIKRGIQPIQYINDNSDLGKGLYREAEGYVSEMLMINNEFFKTDFFNKIKYMKPIMGLDNRSEEDTNYTDEKEWRYIPAFGDYSVDYGWDDLKHPGEYKIRKSNELKNIPEMALPFEYECIKYLIVPNSSDSKKLQNEIMSMSNVANDDKCNLISKLLVTETLEGDM